MRTDATIRDHFILTVENGDNEETVNTCVVVTVQVELLSLISSKFLPKTELVEYFKLIAFQLRHMLHLKNPDNGARMRPKSLMYLTDIFTSK